MPDRSLINADRVTMENHAAARAFDATQSFIATPIPRPARRWPLTTPLLVVAFGLIAAAVLVPTVEDNRRLRHDLAGLQAQVDQARRQVEVNEEFLRRMPTDPELLSRLAARRGTPPSDVAALSLDGPERGPFSQSPFAITQLPPLPPPEPYAPNWPAPFDLLLDGNHRIKAIAIGVLLAAVAVLYRLIPAAPRVAGAR